MVTKEPNLDAHRPIRRVLAIGDIHQYGLKPAHARKLLRVLMEHISDAHYAAGWHVDLEYRLWGQLQKRERKGLRSFEIAGLRFLSASAGGWWTYERFYSLSAWAVRYNRHLRLSMQAAKRGRKMLLAREGGCTTESKAAELYAAAPTNKSIAVLAIRKAAREHRLIAIRDDKRGSLYPVWQFGARGVLHGLNQVLAELALRPGYSEITPFVFLLQKQPRLGASPLEALRAGSIKEVIKTAKEYLF